MGKNNKARRAARARKKARTGSRPHAGSAGGFRREPPPEPSLSPEEVAGGLLSMAASERPPVSRREIGERLHRLPWPVVAAEAERLLLAMVDSAWRGGWQPAELVRQGRRGGTALAGQLAAWTVAADHAGRRSTDLDGRWVDQVEGLALPQVSGRSGWLGVWATERVGGDLGLDRQRAIDAVLDLLANLGALPRLETVLPPPGSPGAGPTASRASGPSAAARSSSDPVLDRIRALLAKAESSTFEAEASAFTAKAHELMARHAVDAALLAADRVPGGEVEEPVAIRIPVDAPYVDVKSLLLQTVADAGRCRAVLHGGLDLSTVVGFADDVAAVEMLFTSLLLQAQKALAQAAEHAPPGTRTRSQSYRSAFLLSFTYRIADRLDEINAAVMSDAATEHGEALLPALRDRTDAVDEAVDQRFGELRASAVRGGYDAAGWAGGRHAADQARLAFGDLDRDSA